VREYLPWHDKREEAALTLYGDVDVRQVNLSFKVEGRIVSLAVDEGDSAQAGAVVAELDRRYFDDELRLARSRRDAQAANLARLEHGSRPEEIAEARALVAQRDATANRAALDFRRSKVLLSRNAAARQEFDQNQAAAGVADAELASAREALRLAEIGPRVEDIDAARADLAAAEANVTQAERRLEDSRLIAPGAGVILTRAREMGAIVQPGETVFTLTLANPLWVRTYVSEPDLTRVRPGAGVEVLTDGAPGRHYRGHVGYISPTAEFTPKTVESEELRTRLVYRVRIVVDDPDGGLRQGMPVTVRLPLAGGGGSR
jgi:HlyD family secretion protein